MRALTKLANRGFLGLNRFCFSDQGDVTFLQMVESYFDKAGRHTSIRPDRLNFYKKPENVVKFTLTLVRGMLLKLCRQWKN